MHDALQSRCSPCRAGQNICRKALGEDLRPAEDGITAESARRHDHADALTGYWQVSHLPTIAAMDASGDGPAGGASPRPPAPVDGDLDAVLGAGHPVD